MGASRTGANPPALPACVHIMPAAQTRATVRSSVSLEPTGRADPDFVRTWLTLFSATQEFVCACPHILYSIRAETELYDCCGFSASEPWFLG